jgi:hypothetical protein
MAHKNSGAMTVKNNVIVSQNVSIHGGGIAAIFPLTLIYFCY